MSQYCSHPQAVLKTKEIMAETGTDTVNIMRKRIFNFAVLAAAAGILAACSSFEEIPTVAGVDQAAAQAVDSITVTFTASFEQPDSTRTSLEDSHGKVKWSANDQIAVYTKFRKNGNTKYTGPSKFEISEIYPEGYSADFSGNITIPSSGGYKIENAVEYYTVYPYSKDATISTSDGKVSISTTLKSEQPATAGTFANNVNISAAKSTDKNEFHFQNLCALLSFTVDTDIVSATLTSNSQTPMSGGTATISFSGDTPSINKIESGSSSVKLTGNIENGENGKQYYFVVYPGYHEKGFTLEFEDKDGRKATMSSTTKITLLPKSNIFLGAITIPTVKWMPSEVGVYSTDGTPEYSYQQYNDQLVWSVNSSVNPDVYGFRIQKMDSRQFFDISGLPATYEVEGTSNVSITENISTDGESTNTYKDTVKVISNDNGIVRLMGENHLYIIKTK